MKKLYRKRLRKQRMHFENNLIHTKNFTKFFKYISKLNKNGNTDSIKITNGELSEDPQLICEHFNTYFLSVFKPNSNNITFPSISIQNEKIILSETLILDSLKALAKSKGCGADNIPMIFWINTIRFIIKPVTLLFNKIANESFIPPIWKTSIVLPHFKGSGSQSDVENYRPISLLCTLSRIFEKCINTLISRQIDGKLSCRQHGFTKSRSTVTNILDCYGYIYRQLDAKQAIDLITIDFVKAFDSIDFKILISKLNEHGISPLMQKLVYSLITNRHQIIRYNGKSSNPASVGSGVPQGSTLSPLLFKIFIDDLLDRHFNGMISCYADDLKVYGIPGAHLQNDLDTILSWSKTNKLSINGKKCEVLHLGKTNLKYGYSINNNFLNAKSSIRDLGIQIDENLTFLPH